MHEPVPSYEELKHRLASAEARSEHFKQVLEAVRAVNQLIISEEDPLQLIKGVCRLLIETMGYLNAWIALWDQETRAVIATADAGFTDGFAALDERLQAGQYPDCVRDALGHDNIVIVKDPAIECRQCPLASEYGDRAGLSRRLYHNNRTYGVLSVSVPAAYAFDQEEQTFFGELATNLSFALHRIEAERIRRGQDGIYASLFENNHAVILLIDPEAGTIVDANPAAERFYGWSRETFKGMHIAAINTLPPAQIRDEMRAAIECRCNHFYFTHRRADGTECDVEVYAGAIEIKGRELLYSFIHDITERNRMEDALRESEARNKAFLHALPDMMFVFDRDGVFLDYHAAESSGLLLAPEQFIGRSVYDVLPLDIAEMTLMHIENIVANGQTPPYWYAVEQEGAIRSYESRLVACGENKFLAIVRDISERRQAEEELRRRENQLQRIFEILPIGLWFADKDGTLLRGNPKGIEIWGAEPTVPFAEYGVFRAWRLPSHEPVEADQWALAKTICNGETIVDELLEIETFDGKRKTILNYTAPVLDGNGQLDGAIVVNLDISDRKALEDQLLQAQKMESIGRLAGGVAHDFNNMLGVILGYAEMLLEQVSVGQRMYKAVHGIQQAAQRSANLTRQLLAFARKQTVAPEVLDLNATVAGMLSMLRRLIGEDIALSWLPGPELRPVRMDPSQIDQILANLCVNARDAIGGATGKVTIETANVVFDQAYCTIHAGFLPGEYVLLAVSDDGCGMDQETLSHLFEPFYTTKDMGEGTGLGSAMVYGIIRQNNGFINVYSEPGQGTTFKMYLPQLVAQGDNKTETEGVQPMACGQETILVVEDESMILEMVSVMLQSQGYTVLAAATPGEALRLAREHAGALHLLMTDVIMPEMNGRELARNLLSLYPALKCLFMSGYTANVIAHHGVLDEGVHFIQKPFSRKDLADKVRSALEDEA